MSQYGRNRSQSRTKPAAVAAASLLAALLALPTACTSGSGPSPAPGTNSSTGTPAAASSAVCADVQALRGDLDQLKALKAQGADINQIKALTDQVKADLNKAAQDATGLVSTKLAAIKTAYSGLTAAIDSLPQDVTASQAVQTLQPQILALTAAVDAAVAGLDCPSPSA